MMILQQEPQGAEGSTEATETTVEGAPGGTATETSPVDPDSSLAEAGSVVSELEEGMAEQARNLSQETVSTLESWLERWFPFLADAPLLQGLAILLIFLLLASFASFFLKRVVARWLARTETDLDDRVLAALTGPVYVTMLSLGFLLALVRLDLAHGPLSLITSLLVTVMIVVWLRAGIVISSALIAAVGSTGRFDVLRSDTVPLFSNLTTIALVALAVYLMIVAWGGNVGTLLALGGVGGLIIGLAAQDTIGNLFAGIFIFADSPYKVGDYINLDTGERGKVTNIGIRSTRLLTRDDVEITIPNSAIASAKIVNESGGPHLKYRIRIPVGVAYGSDIGKVRRVLLEVADAEELAESSPSPRVRMRAFGESSLDFELLCWVEDPELRGRATDSIMVAVAEAFAEHDIEIPFAQRDVRIKELPPAVAEWLASVSGPVQGSGEREV